MKTDIIYLQSLEEDAKIESLWDGLEDVPMNPDTECIEEDYYIWPAGTFREDIWHWFDEHYSHGVYWLMYERNWKEK